MACPQFGAMLIIASGIGLSPVWCQLSVKPMITYRQLDPLEIILWHFNHILQSEY